MKNLRCVLMFKTFLASKVFIVHGKNKKANGHNKSVWPTIKGVDIFSPFI